VARNSATPDAGDIVPVTALVAGVREAPPEAGRARLLVRLSGVDLTGFDRLLGGARQHLAGDVLEITRETTLQAHAAPYRLPARDTALDRWLQPEPLIQSSDPRIAAQARLIVGGGRDGSNPARAAELLTHWVYANLRREVVASVPSAEQVLEARRGDCNAFATLYVAMARSAGLPARTVAGLIYLNGRFYYHAWPEVYLGDWVAVDPTFDQYPADAAHLRFAIGGLARQVELIPLLGRLTLEVL
jgi:transglutaminase-like putative cysteine protease